MANNEKMFNSNVEIGFKSDWLTQKNLAQEIKELEGITVLNKRHLTHRTADGGHIVDFILTISTGVASGILANWIWSKIQSGKVKFRINRQEVTFNNKGELERILVEEMYTKE